MKVSEKQLGISLVVCSALAFSFISWNTVSGMSEVDKKVTPIETKQEYIPGVKKEEEPKEDKKVPKDKHLKKEIRMIAKYIKSRNSRIPTEIADLQAEYIVNLADKNKVNVALINGMVEKESLYDPTAVSKASAKGLMQVLKCDGVEIDQDRIHDIAVNIETGIAILQVKIKKADGNLTSGLNNYSGGAKDYSNAVYANIGRYVMFKEKEEMNNSFAMMD